MNSGSSVVGLSTSPSPLRGPILSINKNGEFKKGPMVRVANYGCIPEWNIVQTMYGDSCRRRKAIRPHRRRRQPRRGCQLPPTRQIFHPHQHLLHIKFVFNNHASSYFCKYCITNVSTVGWWIHIPNVRCCCSSAKKIRHFFSLLSTDS